MCDARRRGVLARAAHRGRSRRAPKARDGEFLYGMDIDALYTDSVRLDWVDWCGVDFVREYGRNTVGKPEDMEDIDRAIATLAKRGLRGAMMLDPLIPFDSDPRKFDAIIAHNVDFAGRLAARFKGTIKWYELGNEPDQYFFLRAGARTTSSSTWPCATRSRPPIPTPS